MKKLKIILSSIESKQSYTNDEAWKLYRLAAFCEAIGWTILITGISLAHFHLANSKIVIPIAGQIHGTFFVLYFLITIFVYPSMNWKRIHFLLALVCGVLPFGTLVFELWLANNRKKTPLTKDSVRILIKKHGSILAMQPSHGTQWELPGGLIKYGEKPDEAVKRVALSLFNITDDFKHIKTLLDMDKKVYVYATKKSSLYHQIDLVNAAKRIKLIDELLFVDKELKKEVMESIS